MADEPDPGLGHLGVAITVAERDGDLSKPESNVDVASDLGHALRLDADDPCSDERFPTRAPAALVECRGRIHLRAGPADAIDLLEDAVKLFPHSRAYFELALALEQVPSQSPGELRERA